MKSCASTERTTLLETGPSCDSGASTVAIASTVDELLELGGGFGRYQRLLMATLCFWYSLGSTTTLLPVFLLPCVQESWSLEPVHFALIESGFFAGNMMGLLVGGGVSDVFGRRYAFRLGFGMVLVASALTFFASGVPRRRRAAAHRLWLWLRAVVLCAAARVLQHRLAAHLGRRCD